MSWIIYKYWKQFIFARIFLKYSYFWGFWFHQDGVVLFFLPYSRQTVGKSHVPCSVVSVGPRRSLILHPSTLMSLKQHSLIPLAYLC